MSLAPLTDEQLQEIVDIHKETGGNTAETARRTGKARSTIWNALGKAARRGLLGTNPVLPGFQIAGVSTLRREDGSIVHENIRQKPAREGAFNLPEGHRIKGVSALVDSDGNVIQQWMKTKEERSVADFVAAATEGLKDDLPRVEPTKGPEHANADLLNQFTVTDIHLGMLALKDETRDADYDLKIAEQLLSDWFSAAIAMSPKAHTAVFAQLGDLLHYDSLESVTPTNHHILDADTRFQRMVRVAIRTVRRIISMLLASHQHVHVIMASANHDPASSSWLREMLAAMYEQEPRLSVDISPGEYYAYEWGDTALFYHHGHKRKVDNVDNVFAATFREMFGRCRYSYSHVGHLHSDAVVESNLMRNERHRTLAPKDAYAAGGGWLSKRDAKVITYHRTFGEVSRITLSPQMVDGWRNDLGQSRNIA